MAMFSMALFSPHACKAISKSSRDGTSAFNVGETPDAVKGNRISKLAKSIQRVRWSKELFQESIGSCENTKRDAKSRYKNNMLVLRMH